jgi:RNA polymerase sigma-70 factor, ECF subfamily
MAALLRYFRDLETAEEAYQEACVKALRMWQAKGPPRDPVAWLIMVGRNAGIDGTRRRSRLLPLPAEETLSDLSDAEEAMARSMDEAHFRDDILRLLFMCCHPALPPAQQIALALRVVSGLSVRQIARAFLVGEAAMEQRITRAKARIARAEIPFEPPDGAERERRLARVSATIYLLFNEGYTTEVARSAARAALCTEAIRLARVLLKAFPTEPEVTGLAALLLLQHAHAPARFAADGSPVLLEEQDRSLWNGRLIDEGLALLDKAMRHRRPGPYQVQAAIAALHARAPTAAETDWEQIDHLYGTLERMTPSPVVTLNRAVAVQKARGSAQALAMIDPLAAQLAGYSWFHGARGAFLRELGRTAEARAAFQQALTLAGTPSLALHLREQLDRLAAEEQEPG